MSSKIEGVVNCAAYSEGCRIAPNFSLVSISQNEIQKRFAGWAAILAVPTMVAGIYGMNFKFMPELDWHYGYPVILSVIVIVCGLIYSAFKRAGWL